MNLQLALGEQHLPHATFEFDQDLAHFIKILRALRASRWRSHAATECGQHLGGAGMAQVSGLLQARQPQRLVSHL